MLNYFVEGGMFPGKWSSYTVENLPHLLLVPHSLKGSEATDVSRIPCIVVKCPDPTDVVILYSHNNGTDLGDLHPKLVTYARECHAHIVAYEYPGYGKCTGRATELIVDQIIRDIFYKVVCNLLEWQPSCVVFWGTSIGSGPTSAFVRELVSKGVQIGGMILHAPFKDIRSAASTHVGSFVSWLAVKKGWSNHDCVVALNSPLGYSSKPPILFLHGMKDTLFPYEDSVNMYKSYGGPKMLSTPENATHNDWDLLDDVCRPIRDFIQKFVAPSAKNALESIFKSKYLGASRIAATPGSFGTESKNKSDLHSTATTIESSSSSSQSASDVILKNRLRLSVRGICGLSGYSNSSYAVTVKDVIDMRVMNDCQAEDIKWMYLKKVHKVIGKYNSYIQSNPNIPINTSSSHNTHPASNNKKIISSTNGVTPLFATPIPPPPLSSQSFTENSKIIQNSSAKSCTGQQRSIPISLLDPPPIKLVRPLSFRSLLRDEVYESNDKQNKETSNKSNLTKQIENKKIIGDSLMSSSDDSVSDQNFEKKLELVYSVSNESKQKNNLEHVIDEQFIFEFATDIIVNNNNLSNSSYSLKNQKQNNPTFRSTKVQFIDNSWPHSSLSPSLPPASPAASFESLESIHRLIVFRMHALFNELLVSARARGVLLASGSQPAFLTTKLDEVANWVRRSLASHSSLFSIEAIFQHVHSSSTTDAGFASNSSKSQDTFIKLPGAQSEDKPSEFHLAPTSSLPANRLPPFSMRENSQGDLQFTLEAIVAMGMEMKLAPSGVLQCSPGFSSSCLHDSLLAKGDRGRLVIPLLQPKELPAHLLAGWIINASQDEDDFIALNSRLGNCVISEKTRILLLGLLRWHRSRTMRKVICDLSFEVLLNLTKLGECDLPAWLRLGFSELGRASWFPGGWCMLLQKLFPNRILYSRILNRMLIISHYFDNELELQELMNRKQSITDVDKSKEEEEQQINFKKDDDAIIPKIRNQRRLSSTGGISQVTKGDARRDLSTIRSNASKIDARGSKTPQAFLHSTPVRKSGSLSSSTSPLGSPTGKQVLDPVRALATSPVRASVRKNSLLSNSPSAANLRNHTASSARSPAATRLDLKSHKGHTSSSSKRFNQNKETYEDETAEGKVKLKKEANKETDKTGDKLLPESESEPASSMMSMHHPCLNLNNLQSPPPPKIFHVLPPSFLLGLAHPPTPSATFHPFIAFLLGHPATPPPLWHLSLPSPLPVSIKISAQLIRELLTPVLDASGSDSIEDALPLRTPVLPPFHGDATLGSRLQHAPAYLPSLIPPSTLHGTTLPPLLHEESRLCLIVGLLRLGLADPQVLGQVVEGANWTLTKKHHAVASAAETPVNLKSKALSVSHHPHFPNVHAACNNEFAGPDHPLSAARHMLSEQFAGRLVSPLALQMEHALSASLTRLVLAPPVETLSNYLVDAQKMSSFHYSQDSLSRRQLDTSNTHQSEFSGLHVNVINPRGASRKSSTISSSSSLDLSVSSSSVSKPNRRGDPTPVGKYYRENFDKSPFVWNNTHSVVNNNNSTHEATRKTLSQPSLPNNHANYYNQHSLPNSHSKFPFYNLTGQPLPFAPFQPSIPINNLQIRANEFISSKALISFSPAPRIPNSNSIPLSSSSSHTTTYCLDKSDNHSVNYNNKSIDNNLVTSKNLESHSSSTSNPTLPSKVVPSLSTWPSSHEIINLSNSQHLTPTTNISNNISTINLSHSSNSASQKSNRDLIHHPVISYMSNSTLSTALNIPPSSQAEEFHFQSDSKAFADVPSNSQSVSEFCIHDTLSRQKSSLNANNFVSQPFHSVEQLTSIINDQPANNGVSLNSSSLEFSYPKHHSQQLGSYTQQQISRHHGGALCDSQENTIVNLSVPSPSRATSGFSFRVSSHTKHP